MPDPKELLYANLHEVFSERNPEDRWAAIERTYAEGVRFVDPEGKVVGRRALNESAQKLLDNAPADFCSRRTAPGTSVPTPPHWPGASGRPAIRRPAESTSSRYVTVAWSSCAHCSRPERTRDRAP